MHDTLTVRTPGQGLHEITHDVQSAVRALLDRDTSAGGNAASSGLCTLFIQHTSASLTIQENADPSAKRDLEAWMNRHVPEHDPHFTHTSEGHDDMPSHIKAALTATSLGIPVIDGALALGTWQGVYLWEHRVRAHSRRVVVHVSC